MCSTATFASSKPLATIQLHRTICNKNVLNSCRGPSCPEISKVSWNFTHLLRMSWKWLFIHNNMLQFTVLLTLSASYNRSNCLHLTTTSHYYLDTVDIGCPVVLLTVFMTALFSSDLHKWFLLRKSLRLVCVFSCLWSKNVPKLSWNLVKSWSWNFTLSCWDPCIALSSFSLW